MPDLPRGTVAFLFTDLEGSTRLWRDFPAAMPAAYARHDAILREAVIQHGGVVYKVIGDAFQAAFSSTPAALAAVLQAQRALSTESWIAAGLPQPLRIRMAVHAGAVDPDPDGDYRSPVLNRLGRLLSAGHGGQALLSQAAFELTRDELPEGAALRDLGEHALKDLWRPERIWQLLHPELPDRFPPLATLSAVSTNLPLQATPLIGRERAAADGAALLRHPDTRLLTLTGPGGTGKTRLALQTAADLLDDFPDGVWFVDLAPLTDPALVPATVADVLGVREEAGRQVADVLADHLRDKRLLLLLDNLEQVLEVASFIARLLSVVPGLTVLATSRVRLGLRAEREYAVPPLGLPRRHPPPRPDQLSQYEAVRLFIARAQAVLADFAVDNESAPVVAEICHRLDGLPLAIELAAARIKILPPPALLARLERRLAVLTGGSRDLPARQQTLRDAIAWSHDLLSAEEQTLFRRLSVFAGGLGFDAAEAVGGADGADDPLEGVASLVDNSLLRQDAQDGEPRFTMLETIREYGLERLVESGEDSTIRDRHAAFHLDLVERLDAAVVAFQPDGRDVLDRLEIEQPNLRLALTRFSEIGDGESLLRLAGALNYFWQVRGGVAEGTGWLERALSLGRDASPGVRAAGLFGLAGILRAHGQAEAAFPLCLESVMLAREVGDLRGIALAAQRCSLLARQRGEFDTAAEFEEESLAALDALPGEAWAARAASTVLGHIPLGRGDLDEAERQFQDAIARQRALGHEPGASHPYACFPLIGLGDVARGRGDATAALEHYQRGLAHAWRFGESPAIVYALGGVAGALAVSGRWELAARLFGATEALCERSGLPFGPAAMDRQRALGLPDPWQRGDEPFGLDTPLRNALAERTPPPPVPDPQEAQRWWSDGRALPAAEAVAEALAIEGVELGARASAPT